MGILFRPEALRSERPPAWDLELSLAEGIALGRVCTALAPGATGIGSQKHHLLGYRQGSTVGVDGHLVRVDCSAPAPLIIRSVQSESFITTYGHSQTPAANHPASTGWRPRFRDPTRGQGEPAEIGFASRS